MNTCKRLFLCNNQFLDNHPLKKQTKNKKANNNNNKNKKQKIRKSEMSNYDLDKIPDWSIS